MSLKRETSRSRQAFEDYYALGPDRSLEKLRHTYEEDAPKNAPTRSLDTLKKWCTTFNWPERVRRRDQVAIQKTEKKVTDAVADMRARQARLGQKLQDKGLERLRKLCNEDITTRDAIAMIIEGAKLERQARGEEGPALDISVLIAETTSRESIDIIALSENIFRRAMEARSAVQGREVPEDIDHDGAISLPAGVVERSEPSEDRL